MKDWLFEGKLGRDLQKVSHLKAKLNALNTKISDAEKAEIKRFYAEMNSGELYQIFNLVEKFGHPSEKINIKLIKEKYESQTLGHDDIALLQDLYKSNAKYFSEEEKNG